jgi:hypothetical protein
MTFLQYKTWKSLNGSGIFLFVAAFALILPACGYAAAPVISNLEIKGGNRGLAMTIGADAPFNIKINTSILSKEKTTAVEINCSDVVYGLNEYRFTGFPAGCPVKLIAATEDKKISSVKITVKVFDPAGKNIRFKQKGNRWLLLLSSAPFNDFSWAAQADESKNMAAVTGSHDQYGGKPYLTDITILHRQQVETVQLSFSGPVKAELESGNDRITAVFTNAKSGLMGNSFVPGREGLVKSIAIDDRGTDLRAVVFINRKDGIKPVVNMLPDKLVIFGFAGAEQSIYFWSAVHGTALSYDFISQNQYPVDYKQIEKKAIYDAEDDNKGNGTFNVGDAGRNPVPEPAVKRKKERRVVIIKDNVNLRSEPSTSARSRSVMLVLPIGTVGSQLVRRGMWCKVEIAETTGWVMAKMVMDSMQVPRVFWKNIASRNAEKVERDERRVVYGNGIQPGMPEIIPQSRGDFVGTGKDNGKVKSIDYIVYKEYGRDPFYPYSQGEDDGTLPHIENLELVGILFDASDRIALFEDKHNKGQTYTFREKDELRNGIIERIRPDKVIFSISDMGISRNYIMKLDKEKRLRDYQRAISSIGKKGQSGKYRSDDDY